MPNWFLILTAFAHMRLFCEYTMPKKCENSKTVLKQIKIFWSFLLTLWDVKHTATTKATVERIIVSLKVVLSQKCKCLVMKWSRIYIMAFLYACISQWHGLITAIYPDTSGYQLLGLVTSRQELGQNNSIIFPCVIVIFD